MTTYWNKRKLKIRKEFNTHWIDLVQQHRPFGRYGAHFEFYSFKYLLWDNLGANTCFLSIIISTSKEPWRKTAETNKIGLNLPIIIQRCVVVNLLQWTCLLKWSSKMTDWNERRNHLLSRVYVNERCNSALFVFQLILSLRNQKFHTERKYWRI